MRAHFRNWRLRCEKNGSYVQREKPEEKVIDNGDRFLEHSLSGFAGQGIRITRNRWNTVRAIVVTH
ncbi:hypothetical protein DPMN_128485 [Dreissena polymorpha]|uniref:Uncharacterized protein n=1 Tax=Dreissena polymorpha TaxID=45954 RepID=A0A9D4GZK2_DREPO|nr:hypothetical protein DPMN_128485 [Dreissena polymorpha]